MDLPREVLDILDDLLSGIQGALPGNLVGVYLRGSLATGDFDPMMSDIDFFAITERPVSEEEFAALKLLHTRLSDLPNKYGHELEGPYINRNAARRFRPGVRYPTIARGEALAWSEHRANWVLERWTVRDHGITLLGPDPTTLIDPVSTEELRAAVCSVLTAWADWLDHPDDPEWLLPRAHKAYVVETMCRALFTLASGELPSKQRAVAWALETLPEPWRSTVERSQAWRTDATPDPDIIPEVRNFLLWTVSQGGSAT